MGMTKAQIFWQRVDEARGDHSLMDIAEATMIPYSTIRNQRAEGRFPKRKDIESIAIFLGVTTDFLETGHDAIAITPEMEYVRRNRRAEWIIEKCMANDRMLAILYSFVECMDRNGL